MVADRRLGLGKAPATHDPRDLLMGRYVLERDLPALPTTDLGHPEHFPAEWGMLGNDNYGDCVWAGADHETMLWLAMGGQPVPGFTDDTALADYSAVTGFRKDDPSTDQGTNMRDAMNYRRKTGIVDASGNRHKIGAFVALQPGNITQLKQCIWLFGAVAIGFEFPGSAMDQFNRGQPWTVVPGAQIEGGHYVPGVLYHASVDMFEVVTWGRRQLVAPSFLQKYMDEAYGVLSVELLAGGRSLEGFDLATLQGDLADIGSGKAPTPVDPPSPTPTPTPTVDDATRQMWADVRGWATSRHSGSNKQAAHRVMAWARSEGLEPPAG
jgi:hypothetical protein